MRGHPRTRTRRRDRGGPARTARRTRRPAGCGRRRRRWCATRSPRRRTPPRPSRPSRSVRQSRQNTQPLICAIRSRAASNSRSPSVVCGVHRRARSSRRRRRCRAPSRPTRTRSGPCPRGCRCSSRCSFRACRPPAAAGRRARRRDRDPRRRASRWRSTSRPTAVALPPADRFSPSSVASTVTSMRGRPSMITWCAPSPAGGIGQSGAHEAWMRVTCSMTMQRLAVDDALHLEPDRALGARLELAHGPGASPSSSSARRSTVSRISSSSTPERPGHQPDLPAPHHGRHRRREHRRLVVHAAGPCRPGTAPSRAGRRWSSRRSPGSGPTSIVLPEAADQQRQHVVAPAGIDAGDEQRAAAVRDRGENRFSQLRRGVALVVERVQRRA